MAEHHDTPGVPGRTAKIIRHEGDKWVLYDHTGKHRLSEHDTEDGALAQERAIEAHKHTDKSIGDHARHAPSGVCGIVKALHPTGDVPEDVEDGRGDADDKTAPAVSIDLHDAKCMPTGVVKAFAASELEPMDGPGVVDRPEAERPASEKGMGEGSGTAGGYTVTPEDEVAKDMDDGDEETEAMDAPEPEPTPPPITKGDRVYFPPHGGMAGGVGVVKSIHRSGKVPGCVNDAAASDDNPHARIQLYKSMGHPLHFHASDDHAAVPTSRCKQLPTIEVEPATKSYGEQAMVEIPVGDKLRLVTLNGPPPGTKGAVAFKSGATVAGEWHEDRARLRLTKAFAESHPAHHRAAFAWFDADRPDDAKAYWGLHHDIEFGTGRVIANAAACNRLLARLDAAELPPGDKPAIRKHLELHLSEAEGASADADESASPTEKALSRIPPFRTEAEWREEQRKAFREVYGGPDAAEILRQAENALYGVIE